MIILVVNYRKLWRGVCWKESGIISGKKKVSFSQIGVSFKDEELEDKIYQKGKLQLW